MGLNFERKDLEFSVLLEDNFRKRFLGGIVRQFGSQEKLAKYLDSKIKNRRIIRENIKNWVRGKHPYGWDILIPIEVLEELCLLKRCDLEKALNKVVKYNPTWKDPNKERFLVKSSKPRILNKDDRFYLDLSTILPKTTLESQKSKKRLPLFVRVNKKDITLWSEACWKKSQIKIRRFLELNNSFFIGSAIFTSEGTTKRGKGTYHGSISLGNSEPSIIKIFLKWINSFLICSRAHYRIKYNGTSFDEKKLKSFWSDKLNENFDNIDISLRKDYGSGLVNNNGVLDIRINNTVLKPFIINLLDNVKKITLMNKEWCKSYLKGLIASEGSVYSNRTLKAVGIGVTKPKERDFIKRLLKILDIKFCEGKNQLLIIGWQSFYNLLRYGAFDILQINNHSKKKRFLEGFKNHQKTQKLVRLEPFKNRKFTAKEWQKHYNLKFYISAHTYLNPLIEKGILKFISKKNKKYFYINEGKSEELKKFIWNL